ncbi:MAG: bacterioferritin-associated ferredoxin [Maricaulaceae bacterium]
MQSQLGPAVIVCLCHNLNEAKVRAALEAGANQVGHVHRHHGVRPKCGRCLPEMAAMCERSGAPACLQTFTAEIEGEAGLVPA